MGLFYYILITKTIYKDFFEFSERSKCLNFKIVNLMGHNTKTVIHDFSKINFFVFKIFLLIFSSTFHERSSTVLAIQL